MRRRHRLSHFFGHPLPQRFWRQHLRDLQETLGHKWIDTTLDYERCLLPVTLRPNSPFGPDHPRPTPFTVPTYPSPQWTRGP